MTGVDPQMVNFAIRGANGELFTGLQGVDIKITGVSTDIAPEDLADRLRDATVLIVARLCLERGEAAEMHRAALP